LDYHQYSNINGPKVLETFGRSRKGAHDADMVYRLGRMHGIMDVAMAFRDMGKDFTSDEIREFMSQILKDTSLYAIGAILDNEDRK
jgi:hypothetical protein